MIEQTIASQEQVQMIRTHMINMMNYTYITKSEKENPYLGIRNCSYLSARHKTAIKLEIEKCAEWLRLNDEDEAKRIRMDHFESELRLLLVKNFIYG